VSMIFELQPGRGLLPLELGMDVTTLRDLFGEPVRASQFGSPDPSLFFSDSGLRVTIRGERAVEATIAPPADLRFEGGSMWRGSKTWQALVAREPNPLHTVGFVILPSLRVAFTGLHDGDRSQRAITVYADGVWNDAIAGADPFVP